MTVEAPVPRRRLVMKLSALAAALLVLAASAPLAARVGGRPPEFELPAVPGGPSSGRFSMAEHLGRDPVVILFWATWCAPCRQELPVYQSLYERYKDQGLVVVAISMDDANTLASSGPMARRLGLGFPVVSDLDTAVTTRLNPRRAAPFSIWIDRSGRIVREREGFSLAERTEIVRGIVRLVRTRPSAD
jgi:thiol-disulfide isomerase/thioredoxin